MPRNARVLAAVVAVFAATAALPVPAAHASGGGQGPRPLLGNVIIFNDEIIEPVSLPVSTCGGLLPLFSSGPSTCEGASRVSDDDA